MRNVARPHDGLKEMSASSPRRYVVRGILVAVALAVAMAVVACGSGDDSNSSAADNAGGSKEPIVLGAGLPMTGSFAAIGADLREGYEMAIKKVNATGGVLGRPLKLKVEDDEGDPAKASNAVRKLITHDGVAALLGTYGTDASIAASATAENYKMPNIQPFASAPEVVSRGLKYLFNTEPLITRTQAFASQFALDKVKPKTAAVVYVDNPFGEQGAAATTKTLEAAGVQIVADEKVPTGESNYTAAMSKVKQADPDVLLLCVYGDDAVVITKEMRQLGLSPKAVMWNQGVLLDSGVIKALGRENLQGMMGSPDWFPGTPAKGAQEVAAAYEKTHDEPVVYSVIKGYQTAQIMADALKQAGSTDREKLRSTLASGTFSTIMGDISFDSRGQAKEQLYIYQFQGPKTVAVWPEDVAQAKWKPFKPWSSR